MSHTSSRGWFVTGTDTGIGKTWITAGLLAAFRHRGLTTLGLKPVASGCLRQGGRLVNEDALALMEAANTPLPYEAVNPCALEPPVSPHLAAAAAGRGIDVPALAAHCRDQARLADICLVEGVGGWLVPLAPQWKVADFAAQLGWPVILVVGIRLGCLNHALLTARSILADGLALAGWVANCLDPSCLMREENIATLREEIPAPLLGTVPPLKKMDVPGIAAHLDTHHLLAV